mmetsp:Transcript_6352/g.12715  ORF Transcript_6352/g.12715 Transcript_6352/m.12715 type:complete len:100 (-) Transcript_6352:1745-2044(-)
MTCNALEESNPLVGSSKKRIEGRDMSSMPMLTRFFSPPDTPLRFTSPTMLLATRERPRLARVASARSSISLILVPFGALKRPAYMRHSLTVSSAKTISS